MRFPVLTALSRRTMNTEDEKITNPPTHVHTSATSPNAIHPISTANNKREKSKGTMADASPNE
jgi:hypothetical protein